MGGLAYNSIVKEINNHPVTLKKLYQSQERARHNNEKINFPLIKSIDENLNVITGKIKEVIHSEDYKILYKLTTERGYEIRATKDHLFMISNNEYTDLSSLFSGSKIMIVLRENESMRRPIVIHDTVKSIGEGYFIFGQLYDLIMQEPIINFVVDGFITHNGVFYRKKKIKQVRKYWRR